MTEPKRLTPDEWRLVDHLDAAHPALMELIRGHIAALEAEIAAARTVIHAAREAVADFSTRKHGYLVEKRSADGLADAVDTFDRDYPEPE